MLKLIKTSPDEQHIEHQPHFHFAKQFEMHFLNDHKLHKQELSCMSNSKIWKCHHGYCITTDCVISLSNNNKKITIDIQQKNNSEWIMIDNVTTKILSPYLNNQNDYIIILEWMCITKYTRKRVQGLESLKFRSKIRNS
jgi:hypothetical protein